MPANREQVTTWLREMGVAKDKVSAILAIDTSSTNQELLERGVLELFTEMLVGALEYLDDDDVAWLMSCNDTIGDERPIGISLIPQFVAGEMPDCIGKTSLAHLLTKLVSHYDLQPSAVPQVAFVLTDGSAPDISDELRRAISKVYWRPMYIAFVGHSGTWEQMEAVRFATDEINAEPSTAAASFTYIPHGHAVLDRAAVESIMHGFAEWLDKQYLPSS